MTSDASDWLFQEVSDLLDVAPVGLYEFVWLLRGARYELTDDEMIMYSVQALERLLANSSNKLVWLRWPSETVRDERLPPQLGPQAWTEPTLRENYLALDRPPRGTTTPGARASQGRN